MVTEVLTEYKELNDDSDFAGFNSPTGNELKLSNFESLGLRSPDASSKTTKETSSAATSSSSSDEEETGDKFAEDALKIHNDLRKKHGVRSMKMSKKVKQPRKAAWGTAADLNRAANRLNSLKSPLSFLLYIIFIPFQLCAHAQEWADKLAGEDRFEHRPDNPHGENLYCSWSSNPKATVIGSNKEIVNKVETFAPTNPFYRLSLIHI